MKDLFSQPLKFDLRSLAYSKLQTTARGADFLEYREARTILGRSLHLPKPEARLLLLEMSRVGLIKFDVKGRIFLL